MPKSSIKSTFILFLKNLLFKSITNINVNQIDYFYFGLFCVSISIIQFSTFLIMTNIILDDQQINNYNNNSFIKSLWDTAINIIIHFKGLYDPLDIFINLPSFMITSTLYLTLLLILYLMALFDTHWIFLRAFGTIGYVHKTILFYPLHFTFMRLIFNNYTNESFYYQWYKDYYYAILSLSIWSSILNIKFTIFFDLFCFRIKRMDILSRYNWMESALVIQYKFLYGFLFNLIEQPNISTLLLILDILGGILFLYCIIKLVVIGIYTHLIMNKLLILKYILNLQICLTMIFKIICQKLSSLQEINVIFVQMGIGFSIPWIYILLKNVLEKNWFKKIYSEPSKANQALGQFYAFQSLNKFGIGITKKKAPNKERKLFMLSMMKNHYQNCFDNKCSCKCYENLDEYGNVQDDIMSSRLMNTLNYTIRSMANTDLMKKDFSKNQDFNNNNNYLHLDFIQKLGFHYKRHWSDDNKNFRNFSKMLLENYSKKFPKSTKLKIHIIQYLIEEMGLYHKAFILLEEFNTKDSISLLDQIMIHELLQNYNKKLKNITEDNGKTGLNIMDMIIYTDIVVKFQTVLERNATNAYEFWNELMKTQMNLKKLFNIGLEIFNEANHIEKLWLNISSIVKKRVDLPYLLYSIYNYILNNSRINGDEYTKIYKRIVNKIELLNDQDILTEHNLFSENNMYFAISAEISKSGTILVCSDNVVKYLGYNKDKYIGKNIEVVMPTIYRKYHASYVLDPIETQQNTVLATTRKVFYLNKDDYIHPCLIQAKTDHHIEYGMVFLGILRPLKMNTDIEFILTDEFGFIDSCTKKIRDILNTEYTIAFSTTNNQYGKVNIDTYCKEFKKINEAFTYKTKLVLNKAKHDLNNNPCHIEMMALYEKYAEKEFEIEFKIPKLSRNFSYKFSSPSSINSQTEHSISIIKNRLIAKRMMDKSHKMSMKDFHKPDSFPSQNMIFGCHIEDYWIRNHNLLRTIRLRKLDKENGNRKLKQERTKNHGATNIGDGLSKSRDDDSTKRRDSDGISYGDFDECQHMYQNTKSGLWLEAKDSPLLKIFQKATSKYTDDQTSLTFFEKAEESDADIPVCVGEDTHVESVNLFFEPHKHTCSHKDDQDEFFPYSYISKPIPEFPNKSYQKEKTYNYQAQVSAPLKHIHKAAMPMITNSQTSKIKQMYPKNNLQWNKFMQQDEILEGDHSNFLKVDHKPTNQEIDTYGHNLMKQVKVTKLDTKSIGFNDNQLYIIDDNKSKTINDHSSFTSDEAINRYQNLRTSKLRFPSINTNHHNQVNSLKKVSNRNDPSDMTSLNSSKYRKAILSNPKNRLKNKFSYMTNSNHHKLRSFENAILTDYVSDSIKWIKYIFCVFTIINSTLCLSNYILLQIQYFENMIQTMNILNLSVQNMNYLIDTNKYSKILLLIDLGYINDTNKSSSIYSFSSKNYYNDLSTINMTNFTRENYMMLFEASLKMKNISQIINHFIYNNLENKFKNQIINSKININDNVTNVDNISFFESINLLIGEVLSLDLEFYEENKERLSFIVNQTFNQYYQFFQKEIFVLENALSNQSTKITEMQFYVSCLGGIMLMILFVLVCLHMYKLAKEKILIMKILRKIRNHDIKVILKRITLFRDTLALTKSINRPYSILDDFLSKMRAIEKEFLINTMLINKSNSALLNCRGFFREIWFTLAKYIIISSIVGIFYSTMPLFCSNFEVNSNNIAKYIYETQKHLQDQHISMALSYKLLSGEQDELFTGISVNQALSDLLKDGEEVIDIFDLLDSNDQTANVLNLILKGNLCSTFDHNIEKFCHAIGNGIGARGLISANSYMITALSNFKETYMNSNKSFEISQEILNNPAMIDTDTLFTFIIYPAYCMVLENLQNIFSHQSDYTKYISLIILSVLIVIILAFYFLILLPAQRKIETENVTLKKFLKIVPVQVIMLNKSVLEYLMKRSSHRISVYSAE